MLDKKDKQILKILQDNSKTTNISISKTVGLAPSGTLKRIKKLEDVGIIKNYSLILDKKSFNLNILAYCFIKTETNYPKSVTEEIKKSPYVQELHAVAGEFSFLVKVVSESTEHLQQILRTFTSIPEVSSTNSTLVLSTYTETNNIPLERTD